MDGEALSYTGSRANTYEGHTTDNRDSEERPQIQVVTGYRSSSTLISVPQSPHMDNQGQRHLQPCSEY